MVRARQLHVSLYLSRRFDSYRMKSVRSTIIRQYIKQHSKQATHHARFPRLPCIYKLNTSLGLRGHLITNFPQSMRLLLIKNANFVKLNNNFELIKMVNFCAVSGCCTRTDIVREHQEDTGRICDVSSMGL